MRIVVRRGPAYQEFLHGHESSRRNSHNPERLEYTHEVRKNATSLRNGSPNDKILKVSPVRPRGCCPPWDLIRIVYLFGGPDSSFGIATRYGLGGSGIESWCGRDFPHPARPVLGPTQPPVQWVSGLFLWGKAAGAWRWPPIPSSAEVKERVELYISPSGPTWPVLRWTLPLPLFIYTWRSKQRIFERFNFLCEKLWR